MPVCPVTTPLQVAAMEVNTAKSFLALIQSSATLTRISLKQISENERERLTPVEQDSLSSSLLNVTFTGWKSLMAGFHALFRQSTSLVTYFLVDALLVPLVSLQAALGALAL